MSKQAPFRLIRRCRLYCTRQTYKSAGFIPSITRGVYVLYKDKSTGEDERFEVFYIGVGGVAKDAKSDAKSGVGGRIKSHDKHYDKHEWTHYSLFEVHDNVSREEILEIEQLLLQIFRHDRRIKLDNVQLGSRIFKKLAKDSEWRR